MSLIETHTVTSPVTVLELERTARVYLYESERARTEELASFALDAFRMSRCHIANERALLLSLRRAAVALVAGLDLELLLARSFEVVWLQDCELVASRYEYPDGRPLS